MTLSGGQATWLWWALLFEGLSLRPWVTPLPLHSGPAAHQGEQHTKEVAAPAQGPGSAELTTSWDLCTIYSRLLAPLDGNPIWSLISHRIPNQQVGQQETQANGWGGQG